MKHTTRNIKHKRHDSCFMLHDQDRQAGVTLLLAVMVMAGITLIAVTVAFLAIQEIRVSRADLYSQQAITAAQAGAEEGLWDMKRPDNGTLPQCTSSVTDTNLQAAAGSFCKSYDNGATINLEVNKPYFVYLYDPDDPNGDSDLTGMTNTYTCLTADWLTGGSHNINVYLTRLDGTPVGDKSQPATFNRTSTAGLSPCDGNRHQLTINNLQGPSNQDNRMILKLVYCEGGAGCTADESASVTVNTNGGMPTLPTIDATGCAGAITPSDNCTATGQEQFNRRINVTVPQ